MLTTPLGTEHRRRLFAQVEAALIAAAQRDGAEFYSEAVVALWRLLLDETALSPGSPHHSNRGTQTANEGKTT